MSAVSYTQENEQKAREVSIIHVGTLLSIAGEEPLVT